MDDATNLCHNREDQLCARTPQCLWQNWFQEYECRYIDRSLCSILQWGGVEREPRAYDWSGYKDLFQMLKIAGLRLQVNGNSYVWASHLDYWECCF